MCRQATLHPQWRGFSGGSHGFIVGHVTPEAQVGGPIAFIQDDDKVTINAERMNCPSLSVMRIWKNDARVGACHPTKHRAELSPSTYGLSGVPAKGALLINNSHKPLDI